MFVSQHQYYYAYNYDAFVLHICSIVYCPYITACADNHVYIVLQGDWLSVCLPIIPCWNPSQQKILQESPESPRYLPPKRHVCIHLYPCNQHTPHALIYILSQGSWMPTVETWVYSIVLPLPLHIRVVVFSACAIYLLSSCF